MRRKILISVFIIIAIGFLIPQSVSIPVKGATARDWNSTSFWFYPWGRSVTHKGVDIFATEGTPVLAATSGIVLYTGNIQIGGNMVLVFTSKWRMHYYAHLKEINTTAAGFINTGEIIGSVGTTGNAVGKAPHLHYSIISLIPLPWRIDNSKQGWKKAFYLNPIELMK